MIDSLRLERGHMGSSPRDCRDDKACIGEGVELWSEQPIEADRCRREVENSRWPAHATCPRYRTRLSRRRASSSVRIPPSSLRMKPSQPSVR
jgi:hypothetical protein